MYSTCLFCNAALGRNEAIEHFPIGGRLAFDATRGRLWVVCRRCERWNLTPLEERWEAVEECERLFRGSRMRVSTGAIGMARVADGTELVRIGEPTSTELAVWRYGDQFGRRRRRWAIRVGAAIGAAGALVVGGLAAGMGIMGLEALLEGGFYGASHLHGRQIVARVPMADGSVLVLKRPDKRHVDLVRAGCGRDDWHLTVPRRDERLVLRGEEALRVSRFLLPAINHAGASRADVRSATRLLESEGGAAAVFAHAAARGESPVVADLPAPVRLAMEMAVHDEVERRAMGGELARLEEEWRRAEEIAAIADDLLLPDSVRAALGRAARG